MEWPIWHKTRMKAPKPERNLGSYIQIIRSVHHLNLVLILFEYLIRSLWFASAYAGTFGATETSWCDGLP